MREECKVLSSFYSERSSLTDEEICTLESVIREVLTLFKVKDLAPVEQIEILQNCEAFIKGEIWWASRTAKQGDDGNCNG